MHSIESYVFFYPLLILPDSVHFYRLYMLYETGDEDMNINAVPGLVAQNKEPLFFSILVTCCDAQH